MDPRRGALDIGVSTRDGPVGADLQADVRVQLGVEPDGQLWLLPLAGEVRVGLFEAELVRTATPLALGSLFCLGDFLTHRLEGVLVPSPYVFHVVRKSRGTARGWRHTELEPAAARQARIGAEMYAFALLAADARARAGARLRLEPVRAVAPASDLAAFARDAATCYVCLEPARTPYQADCGHVGCKDCVLRWWDEKNECGKCSQRVGRPVLSRVLDEVLRAAAPVAEP